MSNPPASPLLLWDLGTAYDLFASLLVLHEPERFGLRGSWAAGVRSRLPNSERKFLEEVQDVWHVPLYWIYHLPDPKDASTALWALGQLSPAERLPALMCNPHTHPQADQILMSVSQQRRWTEDDLAALRDSLEDKKTPPKARQLTTMLEWWSHPDEFGERFLGALQSYQAAFFAEEERHVRPYLQEALEQAQESASQLSPAALLEELSQGVSNPTLTESPELVLVPSFWMTPLVMYGKLSPERTLMLFGARPADLSLVPGEVVPDAMLRALKALADPTRLRVLRYLTAEPLTPSELARRLRLRAPTVIHHLSALRAAGLVRVTLQSEGEKRYAIRSEAVDASFDALRQFLASRDGE